MRIALALVMVLTLGVLLAITLADGDVGQDCSSCHGSERMEGRYLFEMPRIDVLVPENVSKGATFQVLVMVHDPPDYDLVSPKASVRYTSELSSDTVPLSMDGAVWTGIIRVVGGEGSSSSKVVVEYAVHHDHLEPEHPDLATYSMEKGLPLQGADDADPDQRDSPIGMVLLIAIPLAGWLSWGRKRL